MQRLKKNLSILLSLIMIFSAFTIVPVTAEQPADSGYTVSFDEPVSGDQPSVSPADISADPSDGAAAVSVAGSVGDDEALTPDAADEPVLTRDKDADLAEVGAEADLAGTGHYNIAIGTTTVTDSNYNNILGDGTASYNPSTKVLTLNNPRITSANGDEYGAIQIQQNGVTVKGTFHMNSAVSQYGLYVSTGNSVTLEGNFTFNGSTAGIIAGGTVTFKSGNIIGTGGKYGIYGNEQLKFNGGTITAISRAAKTDPEASAINCNDVIVNNGIAKLEMKSNTCAFDGDKLTMNGTRITSPTDAFFSEIARTIVKADYTGFSPNAIIQPFSGTYYPLWLGSRQVTSENYTNIFGDGKASYNPSTKTLTLNNPTLVGSHALVDTLSNTFKIVCDGDLTVKGSYHIQQSELNFLHPTDGSEDENDLYGGIRTTGNLTLDGDFTFLATTFPVMSEKDLTISSGSLTVSESTNVGLIANNGTITVNNGVTKIDAQAGIYPFYANTISLGSNIRFTLPANPGIGIVNSGKQIIIDTANDNTSAKHVILYTKTTQPTQPPATAGPSEPPIVNYNVVLGSTPVTNRNKDNILGDGKASYNPDTKTLTLNNPTIEGTFSYQDSTFKILAIDDITIRGKYAMPSAEATYGVYTAQSVTFEGNFTVMGSTYGVYAVNGVTVNGGTLKATSNGQFAIYNKAGAFTVTNSATKFEGQSTTSAILSPTITLGSDMDVTTPSPWHDASVTNTDFHTIVDDDGKTAKTTVIEHKKPDPTEPPATNPPATNPPPTNPPATNPPATQPPATNPPVQPTDPPAGETYDIWLGSTQVTSANKDNILGDGKATYNPETQDLTLNNPVISGSHNDAKIYINKDTKLRGVYHMTGADCKYGLYANDYITMFGDFTFRGNGRGIETRKYLTVNSGSLKAVGGELGVYCFWEAIFKEDCVKIDMEGGTACYWGGKIHLNGQSVTLPEGGSVKNSGTWYSVYEPDGSSRAKHAVLENNQIKYRLWLGSTQVTSTNKDDILNDGGKAKFDPDTNTLTLNNPTISGICTEKYSENSKIYFEDINLTIKGSYHMTSRETNNGIYTASGTLTLSGDFTFKGTNEGIVTEGFTAESGTLIADGEFYGLFSDGESFVKKDVERIELTSKFHAYGGGLLNIDSSLYISEPEGGTIKKDVIYFIFTSGGSVATNAVIEPVPLIEYNLWLGSTRVTSRNKNDILDDGGKAKFDPDTNTLTLNDPEISGGYHTYDSASTAKISAKMNVTIKGSYHMPGPDTTYGLASDYHTVTLDGDFTFYGNDCDAIYSDGGITMKSGSITLISGRFYNFGLWIGGTLKLEAGLTKLDATGTSNTCGAIRCAGYEMDSSLAITEPAGGSFGPSTIYGGSNTVYAPGASRGATHVIIQHPIPIDLEGDGTAESPYLIKSTDNWNTLADYVEAGGDVSGKFFKMTKSISVTRMVGTNDHPFRGEFDGDYHLLTVNLSSDQAFCAPFSNIKDATIRNITVKGKVESLNGALHCSGLVGRITGTALLQNCNIAPTITCSGTHCGGIIGHAGSSQTKLIGCVFFGEINGGTNVGTIWGWSDSGAKPVLESCLDTSKSKHPIGRGLDQPTITNTYYTCDEKVNSGDRKWDNTGKLAYTAVGRDVNLSKSGDVGIVWGGKLYAAEGDQVTLSVTDANILYTAAAGTLSQNGGKLVLTMPGTNTFIKPSSAKACDSYTFINGTSGYNTQGPEMMLDGNSTTKWCTGNALPLTLTFRTEKAIIPAGYTFTTAGDAKKYLNRNPNSWTLEGSKDGIYWTTLTDTADNKTLEAINEKTYAFTLSNPGSTAYSVFRLTIRNNNGNGGTTQIADIQIMAASYLLGDVDGDNEITSIDISLMQRQLAGLKLPEEFNANAGDIDCDGEISILDVTFMQRALAMMPVPYNIGKIT